MDSMDELYLQRLDRDIEEGSLDLHCWGDSSNLRLYEEEERDLFERTRCHPQSFRRLDWGAQIRFRRFFDSVVGFHSGSLDLYGRHEDRYRDIYSRWNKLVKDIMELLPYIKQLQSQPQHSEDQSKLSHSDTSLTRTTCIITDPVLRERFENNWRARGLDLGFVLKSASKTIRFLACNPNPILQKLTLQRLPPELHHRMMQFEESDIARLLGSTCSYFREISIFYVYESRDLDLPFKVDPGLYGDLTLSTIAELLNKQALDARNRLVEELDFLISHSDIPKKFQLLSVFGQGIGTLQHSTGLEIGTQEYVEFFGPLLPRVYQLLQRTRNVKRLSLQSLPLTEEISQAILSMDHVQTLTLKTCSLEDNVSHPLSASILNVVVHTDLPQLGGIWNLLRLLPKLRYLMISCFPQTISILPSVSTRTTYNPFLLLRRLFLSNVGVEDTLSLISWLRGTDGLKLALFKISAAKLGFSHPLTIQLIRALSRCPLIILVLDGIKYAEPYLLTLISDELPDLITLTLFYRDTRQKHTRPAHWPRPSWEYASYLRGFQKLEFFGWNLQITPPSITLDTMRLFEDGFPPDDIWSHDIGHLFPFPFDYNLRRKHIEDDEFLQEGASSIARAFAAYVPTLRIVAFFHSMYLNFRISRKEDGWVTVSREQYVSCGIMGLACPDDWQWEVSSPNRDGDIDEDEDAN